MLITCVYFLGQYLRVLHTMVTNTHFDYNTQLISKAPCPRVHKEQQNTYKNPFYALNREAEQTSKTQYYAFNQNKNIAIFYPLLVYSLVTQDSFLHIPVTFKEIRNFAYT